MKTPIRARTWLIVIGVVVLAVALALLKARPSRVTLNGGNRGVPVEQQAPLALNPDTVLYFPLDVEDVEIPRVSIVLNEPPAAEETPTKEEPKPPAPSGGAEGSSDLGEMISDASTPLPRGQDAEPVRIPPRPVQITWPDTRRLKHCLGNRIDLRMQVDEDGRILDIEAEEGSEPPQDCLDAALESARQIVFSPGTINGHPVRMWTEVRIEFRAED